jgi:hypothetical protein
MEHLLPQDLIEERQRAETAAENRIAAQAKPVSQGLIEMDQLRQLLTPCWDGNLLSKPARDHLHRSGLVGRVNGWNFLTDKGVEYCVTLRLLRS